MRVETYLLSHERPELLAMTLAGICGFNGDMRPLYVIDDGSTNPAVHAIIDTYQAAGLVDGSHKMPKRGGVGQVRHEMIRLFLEGSADQLVQVESDMLVGPGQITALVKAWAGIKASGCQIAALNTYLHWWCKKCKEVKQAGPYLLGLTMGFSEAIWTSDREALTDAWEHDWVPAARPDLENWLHANRQGASLLTPEIQSQHMGGGPLSVYYPEFGWNYVVYHAGNGTTKDEGPLRQPYPFVPMNFPQIIAGYPQSILDIYEALRAHSPIALPDYPVAVLSAEPEHHRGGPGDRGN